MSDKNDNNPALPEQESNAGYVPLNEGYTPSQKGYSPDHEFGYVPTAEPVADKLPAGPTGGTGVTPAPSQAKPEASAGTPTLPEAIKPAE